jgi:DNA-directed RNA polymerase specialized sigma24 family protein
VVNGYGLGYLKKRLPSSADAEDILQQALMQAAQRLNTLHDSARIRGWFYAILRHCVTDENRQRTRRNKRLFLLAQEAQIVATKNVAACACGLGLLKTLPVEQADLIRRVDIDGEEIAAAARRLNVTKNVVSVRLHRSRKRLRALLRDACNDKGRNGCADCSC